jgi:hypothetical protein
MKLPSPKWSRDELMAFWDVNRNASKQMAVVILGERPKAAIQLRALASFASNVAAMKMCEKAGEAHGVDVYRICAERCIDKLDADILEEIRASGFEA